MFGHLDGVVDEQSVTLHGRTAVVVHRFVARLLIGGGVLGLVGSLIDNM